MLPITNAAFDRLQGGLMLMRSAREIGDLIADGRRRLGWSQGDLAKKIGASRQWISNIERGRTTAEFELVLRALHALEYQVIIRFNTGEEPPRFAEDVHAEEVKAPARTQLTIGGREVGLPRPRGRNVRE